MVERLVFRCIRCDNEIDMTICSNCGKGKYIGKSYTTTEMKTEIAFECPICKDKWNYFNCSCGTYNSPDIVKKQSFENGYISKGCYVATFIFQNENDNRILTLKKFRDSFCVKFSLGRYLINYYYKSYPILIRYLNKVNILKLLIKILLNKICYILNKLYSQR